MATFPNTQLQSQSQLLLDMKNIEDLTSHALSIPGSNKITNISDGIKRQEVPKLERDQTISCRVIVPMKQTWLWYSRMLQSLIQNPTCPASKQNIAGSTPLWWNPSIEVILTTYGMHLIQKQVLFKGIYQLNYQNHFAIMKNKLRSYKIRASGTNHSNLEFQYQQAT